MIKDCNPVQIEGERNIFCPHYRDCLDHASKNYWEYWTCQDCAHKQETEPVTDVLVLSPHTDIYYSVSPSLYQKTKGLERRW
jgi:hypothetical protein